MAYYTTFDEIVIHAKKYGVKLICVKHYEGVLFWKKAKYAAITVDELLRKVNLGKIHKIDESELLEKLQFPQDMVAIEVDNKVISDIMSWAVRVENNDGLTNR